MTQAPFEDNLIGKDYKYFFCDDETEQYMPELVCCAKRHETFAFLKSRTRNSVST
jgi:hypothetical protein